MKVQLAIFVLCLLFACTGNETSNATPFQSDHWLQGTWQGAVPAGTKIAAWKHPARDHWIQTATIYDRQGKPVRNERKEIKKQNDDHLMIIQVDGKPEVILKATKLEPKRMEFENKEYSDPFRIKMEMNDSLNYRNVIYSIIDGKTNMDIINFEKQWWEDVKSSE